MFGPFVALADLHENRATVVAYGLDAAGNVHSDDLTTNDDRSGYRGIPGQQGSNPAIALVKEVSVNGADWFDANDLATAPEATPGADVSYRFTITNTGDTSLVGVKLTDPDFQAAIDASSCGTIPDLAVGATAPPCQIGPCTAQVGEHMNKATVTATAPGSAVPAQLPPDDGNKYQFLFVFENNAVAAGSWDGGNEVKLSDFNPSVTLSDTTHISCSDDFGYGNSNPDGWGEKGSPDIDNDPGWRLSGVQIRKDGKLCVDGGDITTGVMAMDVAYYFSLAPAPRIDLEKYVIVNAAAKPAFDDPRWDDADTAPGPVAKTGEGTWFKFVVENTGDVALTDIELTDSDFNIPAGYPTTLNVGGSFTVIVSGGPAITGQHTNKATVTASASGGGTPAQLPPDDPNAKFEFLFVFDNGAVAAGVWNGGNEVALDQFSNNINPGDLSDTTHISCSDDFGYGNSNPDGWGEKGSPDIDNDPGWHLSGFQIRKDGNLCGEGGVITTGLMDMDPAHYNGQPDPPSIDLEKLVSAGGPFADADNPTGADVPTAVIGDPVQYRFIIKNTSVVKLVNVELTDPKYQSLIDGSSCANIPDLAPAGVVRTRRRPHRRVRSFSLTGD